MYIWLGGAGRSPEDLARLIEESKGGNETHIRYRRSQHRQELHDAHGELIYRETITPCLVLEISASGCSLRTERPFRPGALAPVEIFLPILGMILHIGGMTQWMKGERQIGIRFHHVNARSKNQLEGLMACLLGLSTVQSLKESVASVYLNPSTGDVLAARPVDPTPAAPDFPERQREEWPYDSLVHCGQGRLHNQDDCDWPVIFRSPDNRFALSGGLIDLSLGGCTVRTTRPFGGEVNDPVEVDFAMHGLHFLIGGVTQAIYDSLSIGIQFNPMSGRKREGLALLILELCATSKIRIEAS